MKSFFTRTVVMLSIGLFGVPGYSATTRHWTGNGANNNASTTGNWADGAPVAGDDIVLDATTNKVMTWDSAAPASVGSWSQVGYLGTVTVATVYGASGFTNFTITGNCVINNGVLTHTANSGTEQYRLVVTIDGNLTVGPSGSVDVVGQGYSGGVGQGLTNTKGASHGGHGGREGSWGAVKVEPAATYGSVMTPTNLGTSLRSNGGGAIRLLVRGATTIDGVLSAEGALRASDRHCVGSGGSVWLTTGSLTGTGTVTACGAPTDGGRTCGGGGGRIAIVVTNTLADFSGFSGIVKAAGGLGAGAGTIYKEKPSDAGRGELIVNNNLMWSASYIATRLGGSAAVTCDFSRIILTNAANLGLFGSDSLILTNTVIVWGASGPATNCGGISLYGGTLALPSTFTLSNGFIRIYTNAGYSLGCQDLTIETNAMLVVDQPCTFSNVTARAGAILTHDINWDKEWFRLNITVISNLVLDAGSSVNVDRRGYYGSCGPGVAQNNVCGASHGGQGGKGAAVVGALTYGSIIAPTNFGSGAVSRSGFDIESGGGAAILSVGGTTTLRRTHDLRGGTPRFELHRGGRQYLSDHRAADGFRRHQGQRRDWSSGRRGWTNLGGPYQCRGILFRVHRRHNGRRARDGARRRGNRVFAHAQSRPQRRHLDSGQ